MNIRHAHKPKLFSIFSPHSSCSVACCECIAFLFFSSHWNYIVYMNNCHRVFIVMLIRDHKNNLFRIRDAKVLSFWVKSRWKKIVSVCFSFKEMFQIDSMWIKTWRFQSVKISGKNHVYLKVAVTIALCVEIEDLNEKHDIWKYWAFPIFQILFREKIPIIKEKINQLMCQWMFNGLTILETGEKLRWKESA